MSEFLIDFGTVRDTNVVAEERVPANWDINADGDDNVSAVNKVTGKNFLGTTADFNLTYLSEFN